MILRLFMTLALCLAGSLAAAQEPDPVRASLVSEVSSFVPGQKINMLLHQDIDAGWHTYWINPGDSGDPPSIKWEPIDGASIGDFDWPVPERIPYGPLMNYGYHDEVALPFTVTIDDAFDADTLLIQGQGRILVCEDICIPQKVSVSLAVPRGDGAIDNKVANLFSATRSRIPAAVALPAVMAVGEDELALTISMPGMTGSRATAIEYFPFERDLIDNLADPEYRFSEKGLVLTLKKGFAFEDASQADLSGVLVVHESSGSESITSGFTVRAGGGAASRESGAGMGILVAMAFAFLGGLILNLMPCVFPVLFIKILSLVESVHEAGESVRLHGWVYAVGVIAGFVAIALGLILLRSGGEALGWGFQLQSPLIVGLLIYLFLAIALNLTGLYEVGTSIMTLGGAGSSSGYGGSFATGVLAMVVAAPCTAPFMGAAVGYALTQSTPVSLIIFASLGAGMATPYLMLCYSPALLNRLPAPGAWMGTLRQFLAFPMLAAAVWLLWVLGIQAGETAMMQVMGGCLAISLAVWLRARFKSVAVLGLSLLLVVAALYAVAVQKPQPQEGPDQVVQSGISSPYSADALERALSNGPVFVNFTAAWCITCKVNEVNALDREDVVTLMRDRNVTYLKADWTNEDPNITRALEDYGRSGVPLYLLYRKGADRAEVLPQLLTEDMVLDALRQLPSTD